MLSSTRNEHPTYPPTPVDRHRVDDTESTPVPREECGVFGVWAPGEEVAKLTYYGLYALQHRGQEAAGIAVVRRVGSIVVFKDLGLVSQVFDEQTLSSLRGHIAVGHAATPPPAPPPGRTPSRRSAPPATGSGIALGHNGNLVNTAELRDEVAALRNGTRHGRSDVQASTDSDLVTRAARRHRRRLGRRGGRDGAAAHACAARSAWSSADEHTLYAARDPHGVRPLVLGRLERGWVVASETAALDIVGASFVREVEPGELLAIDADGLRSAHFAAARAQGLRLRVRLPRPAGHHDLRPRRARHPGGDRPPAGRTRPRSRPTW